MEERVKKLEDSVGQIQVDIAAIKTQIPHLATRSTTDSILAQIPHLGTKAELSDLKASLIQWMVGTMLASAALAAAIAFGLAQLLKG